VRLRASLLAAALLLLGAAAQLLGWAPQPLLTQEGTVVILVRHAERADDGMTEAQRATDPRMTTDPPLSASGRKRATLLAEMLRDAGLTHVHSTDYLRTRETAGPTSRSTGIEITLYPAAELEAFARELRSTPGRHLVVGHSNTTYDLVQALGGDPGPPIEALEYDRLYLLTLNREEAHTILLRFGADRGIPLP